MKAIKIFMILAVIGILAVGCGGSRSLERGAQGAALGAGVGYLAGKGPGAVAGGLIGGALGSVIGLAEEEHGGSITGSRIFGSRSIGSGRTPLPWIKGERTAVFVDNNYWGEPLRGVIEEYLRGQGAVIVATPGRRYNNRPEDLASAVYIAELYTERRGDYAIVQIRIIDRTNDNVRATASGTSEIYNSYYYGSGGDYKSFEWAANRALASLH
ncbi:MAG: hypothetical protein V1877_01825 [Candidatus Tagabacteria bacterium]